jgi:hypothetical protein
MVSFETQKEHAIKLSRLPTRPAVYEDKDVLAAQPWVSRLPPVFDNAVARPSTAAGANYNKVSTEIFQTTNLILSGGMPVDQGIQNMESKIERDLNRIYAQLEKDHITFVHFRSDTILLPPDELRALVNWIEEYAAAIGASETLFEMYDAEEEQSGAESQAR